MKTTFKQEYEELKKAETLHKHPATGHQYELRWGMLDKFKSPSSASQLEKAIKKFLLMKGHQAAITEVRGTFIPPEFLDTAMGRIETKKGRYIKSGSTLGQADVSSSIFGVAVHWEVKFSKSDRQSKEQRKFESLVLQAGGFYFIVRTVDDFYDKYYTLLDHPRIVLMRDYEENNGTPSLPMS